MFMLVDHHKHSFELHDKFSQKLWNSMFPCKVLDFIHTSRSNLSTSLGNCCL